MNYIHLAFLILFHPLDAMEQIKRNRKSLSWIVFPVFLIIISAVRLIFIFTVHRPLSSLRPRDASLLFEAGRIGFLLIVWSVSAFAVTSIFAGESTIKEIFTAALYSTVPYILLTIPLGIFSRILTLSESGLFGGIGTFIFLWLGFLLFLSVKELNHYTLGKAAGVCLLIIFCFAVICAVLILFLSLFGNLTAFFSGIGIEIKQKFS